MKRKLQIGLSLILYLLILNNSYSQTNYDMQAENGNTITSCNAFLTSDYNCSYSFSYCQNENYTVTFYTGSANSRFLSTFDTPFTQDGYTIEYLENGYLFDTSDTLFIYDGPDASSPLMHKFTGESGTYPIYSSGSYITFKFVSSNYSNLDFGFGVLLSCVSLSQSPKSCNGNAPASNFIEDIPNICNLNGYCGNTSNYYTSDLPYNLTETSDLFPGTIQNNSWISFVADSTAAEFNVKVTNCSKNMGIQLAVYSLEDNKFSVISDTSKAGSYITYSPSFDIKIPYNTPSNPNAIPPLVKGQKYYIMIDGSGGDVCDYTVKADEKSGIAIQANAGTDQTICKGQTASLNASGAKTYSWSPATGLDDPNISNPKANPTTTITYIVTMTATGLNTDCPFKGNDTVIVNVKSLPVINAGKDTSLCSGKSINLSVTAPGGSTYTWSNGNSVSTISVSPTQTTNYKITVTNNGCNSKDSVSVTVNPNPQFNLGADFTINPGDSAILNPTITNGSTYSWSSGEKTKSITAKPTSTTTYTLTSTSPNGCTTTDNVVVSVAVSSANAGPDQTICLGDSATLIGSGNGTYSWNNGSTTKTIKVKPASTTTYILYVKLGTSTYSDTAVVYVNSTTINVAADKPTICNGQTAILTASGGDTYTWNSGCSSATCNVSPSTTTTYKVTGTKNGCSNTANIIVSVNSLPPVKATAKPSSICKGQLDTLTATGADTYSWSTTASSNSLILAPTATTTYTVTGTSSGCTASNNVVVTVNNLPNVNVSASSLTVCVGNNDTLYATGATTYKWDNGLGNGTPRIISPTTTTTYTVTGSNGTCSNIASITINVNPLPAVNVGNDTAIVNGQSANITPKVSGANSYVWSDGETQINIHPSPTVTTTYTLTVKSAGNCTASDQIVITVTNPVTVSAGKDQVICNGESATLAATATNGCTYTWSYENSHSQSITVKPTVNTSYNVTASLNGNTATSSVWVIVITPVANAGNDTVICKGNSITLPSETPYQQGSIKWNTGETTDKITDNPVADKKYSVTASMSIGSKTCSVSDSVTVKVLSVIAEAGQDTAICYGQSDILNAIASPAGNYHYTWYDFYNNQIGAKPQLSVSPTSDSTMYRLKVKSDLSIGCEAVDSVKIFVNRTTANITPKYDTICKGNTVNLTATGGGTYSWSNGMTTANISESPTISKNYYVTVTKNNCTDIDTAFVSIKIMNVSAGDNINKCLDNTSPVVLTAKVDTSFHGTITYSWNTGENTATINVNPTLTTTYTVKVTEGICYETSTVLVSVFDTKADAGKDTSICQGNAISLKGTGGGKYKWSTSDTTSIITVNPSTTTTYTLTVNKSICSDIDTVIVKVNTIEPVTSPDTTECDDVEITLLASGGVKYLWSTSDTISFIKVKPNVPTTYSVTITDINGCSASKNITVKICDLLRFPNVITPNGDIYNDKFVIKNKSENTKVYIFDRWGRKVFSSDNYKDDWNAQDQSAGTYFFIIETQTGNKKNGFVEVIK
ncbi:MAG: gliding motility-associated C-terminal domain-containing protein [Bacteroidota bacterium]|nr:gliding motility-associated C-terminal domain-containing protein [Bacteroidota bacterium]